MDGSPMMHTLISPRKLIPSSVFLCTPPKSISSTPRLISSCPKTVGQMLFTSFSYRRGSRRISRIACFDGFGFIRTLHLQIAWQWIILQRIILLGALYWIEFKCILYVIREIQCYSYTPCGPPRSLWQSQTLTLPLRRGCWSHQTRDAVQLK